MNSHAVCDIRSPTKQQAHQQRFLQNRDRSNPRLPLARGATASTRQGRGDAFRSKARTSVGRGLTKGLQYFGKRYLNPLLGRWISADPLAEHVAGADLNVYAYVRGAVLKSVDPLGLKDQAPGAGGDLKPGAGETVKNPSLDRYGKDQAEVVAEPGGTSPAPGGDSSYLKDPTPEINNGIGDPDAAPITDPHDPLNGCLDCNQGDLPQGPGTGLWEDFVGLIGLAGGEDAPRLDGSGDAGGLPLGGNQDGTVKGKLVQAVFVIGSLWGAAKGIAKAAYKGSKKGTQEILDAAGDRVDQLRSDTEKALELFDSWMSNQSKRFQNQHGPSQAGFNFETGEVVAGAKRRGCPGCTEDKIKEALGGRDNPLVELADEGTLHPTGKPKPPCRNCADAHGPHSFPPGTKVDPNTPKHPPYKY